MDGRRVRVGVVGCGVVATAYYLPYLMKQRDAELIAVCDTNPARTAACARLFGAKSSTRTTNRCSTGRGSTRSSS
jgi:predicted dehydrogenase